MSMLESRTETVNTISFQTDDFEILQEAATGWDQQYFQMSRGKFEGGIELTQVGSRQIYRERWGRKIRYKGTAPKGSFGFALSLDQPGTANWIGRPTCADTVIFQAPGQESEFVSSDYWDALAFGISTEEVQSVVSSLSGDADICDKLHGVLTLEPDVADRLRRTGLDFLAQAKSASSEDEALVSRRSEQFVKLLLWELVDALQGPDILVGSTRHADIVNRATEFALSEQLSGTGLVEICAHLKVSLRNLHYAFQEVTGMPPGTWLRRIRMNQVHKVLSRSSPNQTLVKQVALANGFTHLGHFSWQYRSIFGCLPSQTLKAS